jgi:hypothetical protein
VKVLGDDFQLLDGTIAPISKSGSACHRLHVESGLRSNKIISAAKRGTRSQFNCQHPHSPMSDRQSQPPQHSRCRCPISHSKYRPDSPPKHRPTLTLHCVKCSSKTQTIQTPPYSSDWTTNVQSPMNILPTSRFPVNRPIALMPHSPNSLTALAT